MVVQKDVLLYDFAHYDVEIEVDFYVEKDVEFIWYITVHFLNKKKTSIIKTIYFTKKKMHFKDALKDVYYETNNDALVRTNLSDHRLPAIILEDDEYLEHIYPMLVRKRTERIDDMTPLERNIFVHNTKPI